MSNWLMKKTNLLFFAGVLFFAGCSEKEEPVEYVARVNETILTKQELENKLADARYAKKHREELIREWIETEVLYREAESEDITDDTLFVQVVNDSRKKLAAAILLKNFYAENPVDIDNEEIRNFYNERSEEFRFGSDVYVYHLIKFSNEIKAINFRNTLIETDWHKAYNVFSEDQSILFAASELMRYDYQLNSPVLARILKHLDKNEVSIIFETEPGVFNIVQLVEKINKNEIPDLQFVKKSVRERLAMLKKQEMYREYLDNLFGKYNIVINRYEE